MKRRKPRLQYLRGSVVEIAQNQVTKFVSTSASWSHSQKTNSAWRRPSLMSSGIKNSSKVRPNDLQLTVRKLVLRIETICNDVGTIRSDVYKLKRFTSISKGMLNFHSIHKD